MLICSFPTRKLPPGLFTDNILSSQESFPFKFRRSREGASEWLAASSHLLPYLLEQIIFQQGKAKLLVQYAFQPGLKCGILGQLDNRDTIICGEPKYASKGRRIVCSPKGWNSVFPWGLCEMRLLYKFP